MSPSITIMSRLDRHCPAASWEQIAFLIHHLFERRWDCPNHNSTAPDRGSSSCSLLASSSQSKHAASSGQSRLLILDPALVGQPQAKPQGRHDSYLQQYTIHMYIRAFPLSKQTLQPRDSRCNNNSPPTIKKVPPLIRGQTFVFHTESIS